MSRVATSTAKKLILLFPLISALVVWSTPGRKILGLHE